MKNCLFYYLLRLAGFLFTVVLLFIVLLAVILRVVAFLAVVLVVFLVVFFIGVAFFKPRLRTLPFTDDRDLRSILAISVVVLYRYDRFNLVTSAEVQVLALLVIVVFLGFAFRELLIVVLRIVHLLIIS
ncbi:MAG: hypothetical protein ACE5D6_01195 [Candidatus Zixiibacteriota bacterium]